MDKWLAKFLDDTPEERADKPDTLPEFVSVSGMSGPFSRNPGEIPTADEASPPVPPLQPGWIVTYCNQHGRLTGGWEERQTCTVTQCHGTGQGCKVQLSNGQLIPLRSVRCVGQTNEEGRLVAAWTAREHGYDGRKKGEAGDGKG